MNHIDVIEAKSKVNLIVSRAFILAKAILDGSAGDEPTPQEIGALIDIVAHGIVDIAAVIKELKT